ncbi:hypothetical protein Goklo_000784 [Gossypium klotzschianum]|uniref:Photosystem I n=2 Tax=Gossypium klotzschianum TaxID=34286 RepID=A0A7J8VY40_9ROSI|nr:hypothetical protein [Gossypium klotzschianum]
MSHLSWASLFLGFHTFGLYVHNDVMLTFGTLEKQILIEHIFAQWIQSAYGKTSYMFDVLLSSMNGPVFNAGLHTITLILVKGTLDARSSKLMPDKKDFSYSFPCDGPGQEGTCDISAWDAFYSLAGMAILGSSFGGLRMVRISCLWLARTTSASLGIMVLRNIYGVSSGFPESLSWGKCSFIWTALSKAWPLIRENLLWSIEDCTSISCKKDRGIRKSRCRASLGNSKDPKGLDSFFGLHSNYVLHAIRDYTVGTSCSHAKLLRCRIVGKGNMSHLTGARQMTHEEAGFTAVRGIVRDQGRAWIFGFNKYLGNCSIFYNEERPFDRSNSALVRRIHQTLSWSKQWSIRHISREENSEVDHLVKLVQHRTFDLRLFVTSLLEGLA